MRTLPTSVLVPVVLLAVGIGACRLSPAAPTGPSEPAPPVVEQRAAAPVNAAAQAAVATTAVKPLSSGALIEDERNTISIFESVSPAVVFVTQKVVMRDWTRATHELPAGSGTGFVWDDRGHIVTNYHVIDTRGRSGKVEVTLGGEIYEARFVGGDPRKDIAVLQVDAPRDKLVPVRLPPEHYAPRVGQKTVAIGNPFGFEHTLTTGVISATGRELVGYGDVTIRDMIQTDASINPGNSGGPLLNSSGELIAMNTMIYSQSGSSAGVGFAVPVSTIRRAVPQIISTGRVERVGIGVSLVDERWARQVGLPGVLIDGVNPGSPAEKAGIRGGAVAQGRVIGDLIVGIDDETVKTFNDLYTALDTHRPGDRVTVKLLREGKPVQVEVVLSVLDEG